mmetsp:Transcript_34445/g.99986  ORF Transcript_34445/g.99986 Transcript_34445/m.99986 type:complete len:274 (-) Transcript_34445:142-963(-)
MLRISHWEKQCDKLQATELGCCGSLRFRQAKQSLCEEGMHLVWMLGGQLDQRRSQGIHRGHPAGAQVPVLSRHRAHGVFQQSYCERTQLLPLVNSEGCSSASAHALHNFQGRPRGPVAQKRLHRPERCWALGRKGQVLFTLPVGRDVDVRHLGDGQQRRATFTLPVVFVLLFCRHKRVLFHLFLLLPVGTFAALAAVVVGVASFINLCFLARRLLTLPIFIRADVRFFVEALGAGNSLAFQLLELLGLRPRDLFGRLSAIASDGFSLHGQGTH